MGTKHGLSNGERARLYVSDVELADPSSCWHWTGGWSKGAPTFNVTIAKGQYRSRRPYLVLFEEQNGPLDDALTLRRECAAPDCVNPAHFRVVPADRSTLSIRGKLTPEERFWDRVEKSDGCWLWTGATNGAGYGQFAFRGKNWLAHRFAYMLTHGAIAPTLKACHRCDTPLCVNPDHLFLGTQGDNLRDAVRKGRMKQFGKIRSCQDAA